jgi:hypothetical protein
MKEKKRKKKNFLWWCILSFLNISKNIETHQFEKPNGKKNLYPETWSVTPHGTKKQIELRDSKRTNFFFPHQFNPNPTHIYLFFYWINNQNIWFIFIFIIRRAEQQSRR